MRRTLMLAALLLWDHAGPVWGQTPEPSLSPTPAGIVVLGPALTPVPPNPTSAPIVVLPGRFVPVAPADGSPSYIAPSAGYRAYRLAPGSAFVGIKYDSPANAEPDVYSWPEVKTPIYILLARSVPGQYPVQLVKNGPTEVGPMENGSAILIQIGPRPPPDPPVPPVPPLPPEPIDPLWSALSAAYGADVSPNKAASARTLAIVYRTAASTSVNDPTLTNLKHLFDVVATAAHAIVPLPALQSVRQVLATDSRVKLPTDGALPLDANLRARCAEHFRRAASLLEALAR